MNRIFILPALLFTLGLPAQMANTPTASSSASEKQLVFESSRVIDPAQTYFSPEQVQAQNVQASAYWKKRVKEDHSNAGAWLNYYRALRFTYEGGSADFGLNNRLDSVEKEMRKEIPGTWEQLFVHYWNGRHDLGRSASIEQAYKLQPTDGYLLRQLVACKLLKGEKQAAGKYAAEWQATGQAGSGYFNYAYNVLQSCAQNCVLITNGEFDTYPVLQQQSQNVRTDVGVMDRALMDKPANRAGVFRNLGLVLPDNDSISPFDADYVRRIATANPGKKIYLAATVGQPLLSSLQNELYLTGLAFRFSSETPVDNLIFLRDNVGNRMNQFYYSILSSDPPDIIRLKMNYALPLAVAARQYELTGDTKKAKLLRDYALRIGTANGKYKEVEQVIQSQ